MASAAIEARSLSSLTALASNPPRYPRNPTHERHEPLVLYIARVPGSRDVFLTPLKPREKVVTAEDVQSCLYYLHIDQPQDAQYLQESSEDSEMGSEHPLPPPVHRKAVGGSDSYSNVTFRAPELPPPRQAQNSAQVTQRKPLASSLAVSKPSADNRYGSDPSGYPGAEAWGHYRGQSADLTGLRSNEHPPLLPPRRQSEQRALPPRPPYPVEPRIRDERPRLSQDSLPTAFRDPFTLRPTSQNSYQGMQPPTTHSRAVAPSASPNRLTSLGASLTLIRRDPSSSAQWNVARIEDHPITEVSSSSIQNSAVAQQSRRAGAPLYIELSNPGYSKFLNNSEDAPVNLSALPNETVFQRRLWMEGTRHNDRSFGHRRLNSHDSNIGSDGTRNSSDGRNNERLSADYHNPEAPFLTRDDQTYATVQIPDKRSSSFRGYAFISPWNGRCEFSTGGAGRTLKCKHIMSGGHQGAASSSPIAANVSELRFNLPSTSSLSSTPRGDDASSKRSSFFSKPRYSRQKSSASEVGLEDELDRLDLSLGQEQAGGGFGGKQAKLGKLIIEDEGLKMMDLLVAANLALYWRVYEKVDGRSRRTDTSSADY